MLPVFITNNHIINRELLNKDNEKIYIRIKEENDIKKLNLNNRLKYTDEEYDITIIEIKEEDEIKNFLELDDIIINDIINNKNNNNDYLDETIYIIQYPKRKLSVSYGVLDKIHIDKKYNFNHKCSTERGSSGSPILNLNNKVIGIHKEAYSNKYNKGTFLNYPIKEFIKLNNNKRENKKENKNKLNTDEKKNELNKNEIKNNQLIYFDLANINKVVLIEKGKNIIQSILNNKSKFEVDYIEELFIEGKERDTLIIQKTQYFFVEREINVNNFFLL